MSWRTPSVFRTAGRRPARNVQLTATIPEQMQPEKPNETNGPTQSGRTLTFPSLPTLAAGAEETYTIRLRAVRAGEVKLALDLASAELTAPLHEEETTTIYGAPPTSPVSPGPPAAPPPPPGPGSL